MYVCSRRYKVYVLTKILLTFKCICAQEDFTNFINFKCICAQEDYSNQPTSVGSQRLPTRELVAFTIRHAFFS